MAIQYPEMQRRRAPGTHSVQLQRLIRNDPRFVCYSIEHSTGDGVWLYCRKGWWNPDLECHFIHEDTVGRVLAQTRYIERCGCDECVGA